MRFNCLLGRLRRIVYTRRFDIAWYGFALALAVAAGWLLSSILNP
jgi:prolipoprotein diacylglyceryltransferase